MHRFFEHDSDIIGRKDPRDVLSDWSLASADPGPLFSGSSTFPYWRGLNVTDKVLNTMSHGEALWTADPYTLSNQQSMRAAYF